MLKTLNFNLRQKHSKSFIKLDDYPMLLKPMKQEMQTLAQKICFNWNGDLDFVLLKLLETYSNAPLEYIVQLFNSSCNTNCTKTQVHNHIQYMSEKNQVKENFISYVSFAIPMSMPNNISISPITKNNHSMIKDLPIIENVPTVNGIPIGENVPIVERT
jgi:hypothetical protein